MRLLSRAALAAALGLSASSTVLAKGADISPADLAQLKSADRVLQAEPRWLGCPAPN